MAFQRASSACHFSGGTFCSEEFTPHLPAMRTYAD
jgi:hypothetical protein